MAKKGKKKVVKRVSSKASIRKKELEGPKEIAERIKKIAMEMVKEIEHGKNPRFKTKLRGRGNVVFDEDLGIITLGDKSATRTFLNIAHARKFLQTTLVMSKTYEYLTHNKTASIREVYYELKHTIGNTKENTFEDQRESDACIVDLEHSIDTIREKLNVHANPKGTLYGDITLVDRQHHNDTFNCLKLGRGGWSIMSRMEPHEIEIKKINAKYVLVIETSAMYERLVEEDFARKNKAILVGTGGQAARGTRRLIHRLHFEHKLPVYVFTDGDPYGWYIYSVIKQGSMALAAHSSLLACPTAKYIGMTLEDVEEYGLQNVTEKMKPTDIKRAKEMLAYEWFKNKPWQNELKKAMQLKIRIEQQALANKSLEFVAKEYLPKKIKNKEFLP
ncbi:MAG: DNA topoisomerase IV subunit A [Candidatus Diapherotrites archaeon]|nr:DNA topoisomerase IV subunit A [Candidatus Diapherotrites archaeon]